MRPDWPVAWVRSHLGHEPADPALFARALTHRSAGGRNNERLEFLGDAVLNLISAEYLYGQFPAADEGELSRLRARVVSGESLARLAATLELGEQIALGPGEMKTGGHRRESILADALEAVCGAVFLEAGFEGARRVMLPVLAPALEDSAAHKDAKTRLQEWLQGRGLALPLYAVEAVSGELHAQTFQVSCSVETLGLRTEGSGLSRRRAEQLAAERLLEQLES